MKTQCAEDMKAKLELNNEQLRAMQEQLGTLFQIMAVDGSEEQEKKLADAAARLWIDRRCIDQYLSKFICCIL
jgi:hypothetical protein